MTHKLNDCELNQNGECIFCGRKQDKTAWLKSHGLTHTKNLELRSELLIRKITLKDLEIWLYKQYEEIDKKLELLEEESK